MKTYILSIIIATAILSSCDQTENLALLPDDTLVGTWQEIEPRDIAQFEGSTYAMMDLRADKTFLLTYRFWTDIADMNDPCVMSDEFHAKGTYTANNGVLQLTGCYSDAAHRDCVTICDGSRDFSGSYPYEMKQDTLVLDPHAVIIDRRMMVK
jgi:hypothetical protein